MAWPLPRQCHSHLQNREKEKHRYWVYHWPLQPKWKGNKGRKRKWRRGIFLISSIKTTMYGEKGINGKQLSNNKKHSNCAFDTTLSIANEAIKQAKVKLENAERSWEFPNHTEIDLH